MDSLPPEVLHKIAKQLDFAGLAAFRRAGSKYAAVGTEYLATTVRFYCSQASLDRLKLFMEHPVLRGHVTTVKYEGSLIGDVGCEHAFSAHFELDHHYPDRPRKPSKDSTKRELRLYQRNLAKWEDEIEVKYHAYIKAYHTQQSLLSSSAYRQVLQSCQTAFPRLENIIISTMARCEHAVSRRYATEFPLSCDLPLADNSSYSIQNLSDTILHSKNTIQSNGHSSSQLRSLDVSALTPAFFSAGRLPQIKEVFKNLKKFKVLFRAEAPQSDDSFTNGEFWYRGVRDGHLREALSVATGLEQLDINFSGIGLYEEEPQLISILGNVVLPKLKFLDLDCLHADDEYFVSAFRRQPSLEHLYVGNMTLTAGSWADTTVKLRQDLNLKTFYPCGILEDPDHTWCTEFVDSDSLYGGPDWTLGTALDVFVTDPDYLNDDEDRWHPLLDNVWQDEEELMEELEFSDG